MVACGCGARGNRRRGARGRAPRFASRKLALFPAAGQLRPADGSLRCWRRRCSTVARGRRRHADDSRSIAPVGAHRRLNKARYRRDEPPAPDRPWSVNPPVYDERGHRAPIRDVLPMVPVRSDDPTRSRLNDLLLYRLPAPPWVRGSSCPSRSTGRYGTRRSISASSSHATRRTAAPKPRYVPSPPARRDLARRPSDGGRPARDDSGARRRDRHVDRRRQASEGDDRRVPVEDARAR